MICNILPICAIYIEVASKTILPSAKLILNSSLEWRVVMGNVYSLDTERNLILYRAGTSLYIRSTSGENMTQPVTLCNDYRDSLTDTAYNGTVYYAYRSTKQDLVVRSITDLQKIYLISSREIPDCHDPRLVTFREELVLFYTTKSPLNNAYYLKAVFPLKPEIRIRLPETAFPGALNLGILVMADRLIVSVVAQKKELLFLLNHDFEPVICPQDSPALKAQLDEATAKLHDMQQKLNDSSAKLHDTQQKLDDSSAKLHDIQQKLNTTSDALLNTKQKFSTASEELAQTKNSLADAQLLSKELKTQNAKLEAELHAQAQSHNETIESIRAQYNELMETATRYREEAVRWHEIACKKEAKPIPGENLIADAW